ncbi:hypothetical protein BH11PLA2_BH11PLA2_34040 [soil metagenome]
MALSITCPGCDADYSVPENLAGKSIRCKGCGETIAVKAPKVAAKAKAPVRAARDEDDEDDVTPKARTAAKRRYEEDEDDEDEVAPKKSNVPMMIFGLVALLIAGGVGGYFAFADPKPEPTPVVKADDTNGRTVPKVNPIADTEPAKTDDQTPKKTETPKTTEPAKTEPTKAETPKTETPKTETPKVETPKKAPPELNAAGNFSPGGSLTGISDDKYMDGRMDPLTFANVKKASVFIKADGGQGSGWFGLSEGLVFTNAHVLNMIAPNTPKPKKVEFVLNAGTSEQRVIPHANIEILAVDREIDLAVCRVSNEKNLPVPLRVRASGQLRDQQKLNTVGYPFGSMVSQNGKDPEVSVRPTQYTANRRDIFGDVRRVQIEGGVYTGNSGGPIVDAEGTVMGVVVEVQIDQLSGGQSQLGLGVPTEYVFGIAAGRISEVEYDYPHKKGDKIVYPVKAKVLDPLGRFREAGIAMWFGNVPEKNTVFPFRKPSLTKTVPVEGDSGYKEVVLKYDAKAGIATGEIEMAAPPEGQTIWTQAFYGNPTNPRYYMAGMVMKDLGPALSREPTNLTVKLRPGSNRSVTMTASTNVSEEIEGEGQHTRDKALTKKSLKIEETTLAPVANDPVQAARLKLTISNMDIKREVPGRGKEQPMFSPSDVLMINKLLKGTTIIGQVNKQGEMYKYNIDASSLQDPRLSPVVQFFTGEVMEGLVACSIPLPNKEVAPNETWTSTKNNKILLQQAPERRPRNNGPGTPPPPEKPKEVEHRYQDVAKYTYLGIRERGGRKEAVVRIESVVKPPPGTSKTAHGETKGWALIELDTGVVLKAQVESEFNVDTSAEGVKKSVAGIRRYSIERGSSTSN